MDATTKLMIFFLFIYFRWSVENDDAISMRCHGQRSNRQTGISTTDNSIPLVKMSPSPPDHNSPFVGDQECQRVTIIYAGSSSKLSVVLLSIQIA